MSVPLVFAKTSNLENYSISVIFILIYVLIWFTTSITGIIQSFGCFSKSHSKFQLFNDINHYWFYLVYSTTLTLISVRDLNGIVGKTVLEKRKETIIFVLFHAYIILITDTILLTYCFTVSVPPIGKLIEKIELY